MGKEKKMILILVAIIILGVVIYEYPLQKALTQRCFESYITKQGIVSDNITSKKFIKDWKRGGYKVAVTFKDDVDNKYYYHYDVWTHKRNEPLKFNVMTLEIVNEKRSIVLEPPYAGKCKHPPIQE